MSKFFNKFCKVTGILPQHIFFKKKIYYENDNKELRKIDGSALIVANHTSVYDYPLIMYVFNKRHIHCLIGEQIYKKKALAFLVKHLGNVKVDREAKDFSFMEKTINLLKDGEVCLMFPEARLHTGTEDPNALLDFKPSFVHIALQAGVPIIPLYTNGIYGKKKKELKSHAKVIIGNKIYPQQLIDKNKSDRDNINAISDYVKQYILKLKEELNNKDHE